MAWLAALLAALAAIVATSALAAGPTGVAVRMTHKISIRGELVDHWTIDDPHECAVGDGTLTVRFRTTMAVRSNRPSTLSPPVDPQAPARRADEGEEPQAHRQRSPVTAGHFQGGGGTVQGTPWSCMTWHQLYCSIQVLPLG